MQEGPLSTAFTDVPPSSSEQQSQLYTEPIYHQYDDVDMVAHHSIHQQHTMTEPTWVPQSGSLLHPHQVGGAPSVLQMHDNAANMHPFLPDPTTTVSELLSHCERGLSRTILQQEDITEIEGVLDILTLLGSAKDAFDIANELLMHLATSPPNNIHGSAHLSRVAIIALRSARVLHGGNRPIELLNHDLHSGVNLGPGDEVHRRLLLSSFAIVFRGSAMSSTQQVLELGYTSTESFGSLRAAECIDWRYLVLITNLRQLSAASGEPYDADTAWRTYFLPRRFSRANQCIEVYLERLLGWCSAALSDVGTWAAFDNFSSDLWSRTSESADIVELERKTLFCYFYSCVRRSFHAAPYSEYDVLLQDVLAGLRQYLHITTSEALDTVARMLIFPTAQSLPGNSRANLAHRSLCRMQRVRDLNLPLGILTAPGWTSSSFSASFLEALAHNFRQSYRFQSRRFERRVDAQVRDFLDRHLALNFSMNAFQHDPSAWNPPSADREGGTANLLVDGEESGATSLVDLILYDRS
jgi:hypothetical protein